MRAYRISFDDFEAMQNLHLGKKRWIMQVITGMIAALAIGRSVWLGPDEYPISQALIFAGILLASGFVFAPWAMRRRYKKAFEAQENVSEETRIEWDNGGVAWVTDSGRVEIRWAELLLYKVGKDLVLLYDGPLSMRPVPLRVFESEAEKGAFLERIEMGV